MGKVYIFGHQNPDTDSVTASISLSYLKNKLGMNTEPRILGHINKETKYALSYFNVKEPKYLNDVKLQLKDVEYLKGIYINKNSSIYDVYEYLNNKGITGVPIVDDDNKYIGIITVKDIAKELIKGDIHFLDANYDNILNVINGEEILKFDDNIKGNVLVASYRSTTFLNNINLNKDNILIVGDRHSIIEDAVIKGIKLIIITGNGEIKDKHLEIAKQNRVNIIRTENDSFYTSKSIGLSNSISLLIRNDDSKIFRENDYYDDFVNITKKLKHNNYPILDNHNKCLGLIRITEIVKNNNKEVILVDHQEIDQSVTGLEEANILEIVDHHKIGNINTNTPINFRNMAVGSTNTIIYFMYDESNIKIPKDIAGIMLSGILSDTLCLKSPTTTSLDKKVVESLSKIIGIDYEKYAINMFRAGTSIEGLSVEEVIKNDFKSFPVGDEKISIGQVFTLDVDKIFNKIDDYIKKLEEINTREGYKFTIICITDILKNGSYILYTKYAKKILENIYNIDDINQGYYIDGLVSRKKQILPLVISELN